MRWGGPKAELVSSYSMAVGTNYCFTLYLNYKCIWAQAKVILPVCKWVCNKAFLVTEGTNVFSLSETCFRKNIFFSYKPSRNINFKVSPPPEFHAA